MSEKDMGQKIYELRKSLDLTLEDVAKAVGVGKSTVRKWETGMIANMRRDKIASLAKVLHTSPAYLMGWDEDAPAAPKPPEPDSPQIDNPDIRMIARAGKKMTPEQAADLRKFAEYMYPEAFKDDE